MEKKNCNVPHMRSRMKMMGMRRRRVSTWTTLGSITVFLICRLVYGGVGGIQREGRRGARGE